MRVIVHLSLFFCSLVAFSQSSEFRKIVAEKNLVDRESYFNTLREFQKANTTFSSVYFQLGNVEMDMFSNLDPITERVESRQRILNIKTNYSLAKNYLDPKEIGRYPEWYNLPALKDKDSLATLGQHKMAELLANSEEYATEYENLILNYDEAVTYYLKAREGFIEINTGADNLRQLFLEAEESLKSSVRQVGTYFDSCIYHLNIYRDTYQLLPFKEKRKVDVNLLQIDHFRMNGITPVNFLADEIDLWDYGSWSTRFLDLLRVEVDGLQEEIIAAYEQFESTNQQMIYGEDCLQAELDDLKFQRIINLISKYDNQSVLADIFRYLISKLSYGNQYVYERNCNVYGASVTDDLLSRKARVYQSLFQKLQVVDSLNDRITRSDNSETTFMWFFDKMMDGANGSRRFAENQEVENNDSFKQQILQLTSLVARQYFLADSSSVSCFEPQEQLLVAADTSSTAICFQKMLALNDSLTLLLGTDEEDSYLVGATPIELDYQKHYEINPSKGGKIDFFKVVGDSSFVIGGIKEKAWINYHSYSGREISSVSLNNSDTIVNVSLNQLLGTMQVTQMSGDKYTLSNLNFGGKVTSKMEVSLPGRYVGSITEGGSIILYHLSETSNELVASEVADEGSISNQVTYAFDTNIKNPKIIKNDNQLITLIAGNEFEESEVIYALLDYNGEVKHEKVF